MKSTYYLLKLRASSLTFPKNWEVGLKGRMTPASSIPLQSKDTALFQRDLNPLVQQKVAEFFGSKDTALFQRDLNTVMRLKRDHFLGRKTLPCSKGI